MEDVPFNCCPKAQCRGHTNHSTLNHYRPQWVGETWYTLRHEGPLAALRELARHLHTY